MEKVLLEKAKKDKDPVMEAVRVVQEVVLEVKGYVVPLNTRVEGVLV